MPEAWRVFYEHGDDPALYLLTRVGKAELDRVGKPLNLGNQPAYLRVVLEEHCDRTVMPMRALVFALLDAYARERGWLWE